MIKKVYIVMGWEFDSEFMILEIIEVFGKRADAERLLSTMKNSYDYKVTIEEYDIK